jgi:hypothetical protein
MLHVGVVAVAGSRHNNILTMPSANTSHNHPQQRRTFRGRGGPNDGNLPPKKNLRRRVKYQATGSSITARTDHDDDDDDDNDIYDDEEGGNHDNNVHDGSIMMEQRIENSTINTNATEFNDIREGDDDEADDKLLPELKHLRKRIRHLVDSFQTSRGMGNPSIWQSNCLLPTKNSVKEWRSIVKFYSLHEYKEERGGVVGDLVTDGAPPARLESPISDNNSNVFVKDAGVGDTMEVIDSTTQELFGLIQMSLQVGPLLGSNPGYFKRCGGEVASMALAFLNGIADLAVDMSTMPEEVISDNDEDVTPSDIVDGAQLPGLEERLLVEYVCDCEEKASSVDVHRSEFDKDGESSGSDDDCILPDSASSSDSEQDNDDEVFDASCHAEGMTGPPSNAALRRRELICNMQDSFLFTEKQSTIFYQWMCNAENASRKNKTPSKSAVRLQSLKSKKQKQKELKMERKMKKKIKGGGRK